MARKQSSRGSKKKVKAQSPYGRAVIKSSFNNTMITITDQQGNVIAWASGGTVGYTGSRKGFPFAAQLAAEQAARKALDAGVRKVDVYMRGPGPGRETAFRTLQGTALEIGLVKDVSAIPHNGCRPKKRRRI